MAERNRPQTQRDQTVQERVEKVAENSEFTMPEEFNEEDVLQGNSSTATAEPTSLTLDQLNNVGFNDKQDEAEYSKLNPPVGDWLKEDRWACSIRVNNSDIANTDLDSNGRTTLNFMGKPESRQANGIEYQPMLFLRISPDIRYKQDKPTEVDMAYKLFLRAKELYLQLNSEKPKNIGQLVNMLTEDSFVLRTMNGDNGPIVVDIKVKRQAR